MDMMMMNTCLDVVRQVLGLRSLLVADGIFIDASNSSNEILCKIEVHDMCVIHGLTKEFELLLHLAKKLDVTFGC